MNITLTHPNLSGIIRAIPSKSHVHRMLICAALADRSTTIFCPRINNDISATMDCLNSLGANITYENGFFTVNPITETLANVTLDCGESGSTLRFILPLVTVLGKNAHLRMSGRLPERPLSPLYEQLVLHGAMLSPQGSNPLWVNGKINGGKFSFDGGISSQFTTGLLLSLPLMNDNSEVELTGKIESQPYIDLTIATMKQFGASVERNGNIFNIPACKYISPGKMDAEGDWSNAAFLLVAGAFSDEGITVNGIDPNSTQGDKEIISILQKFGAICVRTESGYKISRGKLKAADIDASDIPDLIPIVSVLASVAEGKTTIHNCARLRLKESDRLQTIFDTLNTLGADIKINGDSLVINGKQSLDGGIVSSYGDHRIAMSAAVASMVCSSSVTIEGAEAVRKSYPDFFEDITTLSK